MPKVVVIGAGGAGCGAAIAAAKAGADTLLLERTDMVFGAAMWAGKTAFSGIFVIHEECRAMGGREIFEALESIILNRANIVDEEFGYVYNCPQSEAVVRQAVIESGVKIRFEARAVDVIKEGNSVIKKVILADGSEIEGDVFVDATGTAGGLTNCIQYGGGACVMCPYYRCPIFGDRVGIATKAGAKSYNVYRPDGTPGTLTAAIGIYKESLSPELRAELEEKGAVTIPFPPELVDYSRLERIGAIRSRAQMENINLVDNGVAKCVGSGNFPLETLRKIRGFEKAQLAYPLGGGNKVSRVGQLDINRREDTLRIPGFKNLFGAGTKIGIGGVAEVISSGYLAGHNATRAAAGKELLELPTTVAQGDALKYLGDIWRKTDDIPKGHSFAHGPGLERLKRLGFYTGNAAEVHKKVEDAGLKDIYDQKIV